jgi:cysteinyl-tRNA synthetase
MSEAVNKDKQYNDFFLTLRALLRDSNIFGPQRWYEKEVKLNALLSQTFKKVDEHLCDNLNFPSALKAVDELIYATNIYLKAQDPQKPIL